MTSKMGAAILAVAFFATPALAQSNGQAPAGNANAPGALMTTCPTQQDGHKAASQGSAGTPTKPANPASRPSTGINGATTCPDGTVPPTGTTRANGGAGA